VLPQRLSLQDTQVKWATQLDPVIANPLLQGQILPPQILVSGNNVINHGLQRNIQGWIVIRINAAATIYETTSTMPILTLNLNSSAPCTVSLLVF